MFASSPLLAAAAAFAIGIGAARAIPAPGPGSCLVLGALFLLLASCCLAPAPAGAAGFGSRAPLVAAACVLAGLCLAGMASARNPPAHAPDAATLAGLAGLVDSGMGVRVEGTVRGFGASRGSDAVVDLELERVEGTSLDAPGPRVRLRIDQGNGRPPAILLLPGDRIALSAVLVTPRRRDASEAGRHVDRLRRAGVLWRGTVKSTRLIRRLPGTRNDPARPSAWMRRRLLAALERAAGPGEPAAGLLAALALGERGQVDERQRLELEKAGMAHVLAISGMHVAWIVWLVLCGARSSGLPPAAARVSVLAVLPLYVSVTGMRASAVRAGWMAGVWVLGRLLARGSGPLNALGLAALLALLGDPEALGDLGFQLSFGATASLLLFTPPLEARLRGPRWLRRGLSASLTSTAGVAPVLGAVLHRMAPIGVLANLAGVPLAGLAVTAGGGAALLEAVVPGAGRAPAWLGLAAVQVLLRVSALAGRVPGGSWTTPGPSTAALTAYYGLLAALALRWSPRGRALLLAAWLVVGLGTLAGAAPRAPAHHVEVHVLDVGQGDAIVVLGPGNAALLVDAGGAVGSSFDVGARVVAPALWALGVRRLDLVAGTHAHRDHIGGLASVVERFRPREVWLPESLRGSTDRDVVAVRRACRGDRVPLRWVRRGRTAQWGSLRLEVLHAGREGGSADANRQSLVLRLTFGRQCFMLTGDAGHRVEAGLAARGEPGPCQVLKVGHHGSRGATSRDFLERVRPRLAAISVGRGNPWGHPHREVLDALARRGIRTLRTDRNGSLSFRTAGRWIEWKVAELRPGP